MRALLDSILLYSQATSDNAAAYGMVDLKSAVQGAVKALQPAIVESGARVEVDPLLPLVWASLLRLQQVFQCLIGNAIAYQRADRAPEVHIAAGQSAPGEWLISLRDNGIGIEKQYHQAIFAPFKRLHGREIPGSGLGLAICRRIVEAHGGRIWVESSTEGSTFMFTLREGPLSHEPLHSSFSTSPSNSPIFKNS
jgi:light-regulated signal transduction histidine kinase (bacteriophytochrome)